MNQGTKPVRNPALRRPAKKSRDELFPESFELGQNIEYLMRRYREKKGEIAAYLDMDPGTFARRLAKPWEFRMEELERLAARWSMTVSKLVHEIQFVEDDPLYLENR